MSQRTAATIAEGEMARLFRRATGEEAQATIARVTMTERRSYGEAKVRVAYLIEPVDGTAFEVSSERIVKMSVLPQPGQRVRVRYDADTRQLLEIVTKPGEEEPPPPGSEPTKEIPWNDSGQRSWWANDTRRR